jgi:hypothetical protein
MHAAVVRLQQHAVDLRAELLDRAHDLHAHALELLGILRDARRALGDILAALRVGMRDAEAGELRGIGRVLGALVEDGREGHDVRGIETDDADLLRRLFGEERSRAGDRVGKQAGESG